MSYRSIDLYSQEFEKRFAAASLEFFSRGRDDREHNFLLVFQCPEAIFFDFVGGASTERGAFMEALFMHRKEGNPIPDGSMVSIYAGCTDAGGRWTGKIAMVSSGQYVYLSAESTTTLGARGSEPVR